LFQSGYFNLFFVLKHLYKSLFIFYIRQRIGGILLFWKKSFRFLEKEKRVGGKKDGLLVRGKTYYGGVGMIEGI